MIMTALVILPFIIIGILVFDSKKRDSVEVQLNVPFIRFTFKSKNDENSGGNQSNRKKKN